MNKIKIDNIYINVDYLDKNEEIQTVLKTASTFESAQEALGKLERFMSNLEKENNNEIEDLKEEIRTSK